MTTRRAFFTVNNPTFKDSETLYDLGHNSELCKYLIYGAEHTEEGQGTPHFQGFVIFTKNVRRNQVCKILGGRAWVSFPPRTDPSGRMSNYCKKEGFYMEFGSMTEGKQGDVSIKGAQMKEMAIKFFNEWEDNKWKRMKDMDPTLWMCPGFLNAWKARRAEQLGPDRDLRVITIIGPTACGKSYAVHNLFPDHAKCFYGNSGAWFSNADAPCLLFEEFTGQIPLQKMLTLLDHYPLQLEVKGGMVPALYTTVCITSNVSPDHWYGNLVFDAKKKQECEALGISVEEATRRWEEAKKALYDRLGFRSNKRGTGHYMEWVHSSSDPVSMHLETLQMRREIWDFVYQITCPSSPPLPQAPAPISISPPFSFSDEENTPPLSPGHKIRRLDAEDIDAWAAAWMEPPSSP